MPRIQPKTSQALASLSDAEPRRARRVRRSSPFAPMTAFEISESAFRPTEATAFQSPAFQSPRWAKRWRSNSALISFAAALLVVRAPGRTFAAALSLRLASAPVRFEELLTRHLQCSVRASWYLISQSRRFSWNFVSRPIFASLVPAPPFLAAPSVTAPPPRAPRPVSAAFLAAATAVAPTTFFLFPGFVSVPSFASGSRLREGSLCAVLDAALASPQHVSQKASVVAQASWYQATPRSSLAPATPQNSSASS
jgi:hypothetical protein